jgi:hypothetical protein
MSNEFKVKNGIMFPDGTVQVTASTSSIKTAYATLGDGSNTVYNISHNMNVSHVITSTREISSGNFVYPDITHSSANILIVSFVSPPSSNQYLVSIIGF